MTANRAVSATLVDTAAVVVVRRIKHDDVLAADAVLVKVPAP
jgi:hypothetical protein